MPKRLTVEQLRSARVRLAAALDAGDLDSQWMGDMFADVTASLRLPMDVQESVVSAFLESGWQFKRHPWSYLRTAAMNAESKRRGVEIVTVADAVPNTHRGSDVAYLDKAGFKNLDKYYQEDGTVDSWQNLLIQWDHTGVDIVALVAEKAGLSADELTVLRSRLDGGTRNELGRTLGWDQGRAERAWRSLHRKMPPLRRAMRLFVEFFGDGPTDDFDSEIQCFRDQGVPR